MAQRPAAPCPQGAWLPDPRPDAVRDAVPVQPVLRSARPAPGQVRDAAACAKTACRSATRSELRRLAPHGTAARLRIGRPAGAAAAPPRSPQPTSSATKSSRSRTAKQAAGPEHPRPGRAGAGALRPPGPSPQHRTRAHAGKKTLVTPTSIPPALPLAHSAYGRATSGCAATRSSPPRRTTARGSRRGAARHRRLAFLSAALPDRPAPPPVGTTPRRCPPGCRHRWSTLCSPGPHMQREFA